MKLERFNTLNEGKMKELLYDVVDQVVPKIDSKEYHKAKDKVAFVSDALDKAFKDMDPKTAKFADTQRDGVIGAIMHQMEEALESVVAEEFDREDTFGSDADYKEARKKLDSYQDAVNAWMKANKTNGIPTEVTKDFPYASEVNNDLRSKIEKYEFLSQEPIKYFIYVSEKNKTATTWTGQKLGDVTFGRAFKSNMGDMRVPISVKALNGLNYYGTFFKSAGDYAVIKKSKKQNAPATPKPVEEAQRYYDTTGKEKPAKETVQKYYSNGVKHDDGNAVTKNAGTGKLKRFADLDKKQDNKPNDKKKNNTKPGTQKVAPKDQIIKVKVNEAATKPLEVKFKRWNCVLEFGQYNNDRTAIELVDKKNGEPVLVATVNIPSEKLADDEIIIKNWSENEGILDVLKNAGIISDTIRKVPTGFVEADVVKLLKK